MANLRTNNLSGEQGQNAYRGSVSFNDDDYLQIADSADIEIGSNDYTVEFWAIFSKKTSSTDYEEIVNKGYPFQIYRYTANDLIALAVDSNTSTYDINATFGTATRGDWHHIAVSRSGNTTKAFLNGIQGLSSTSSTSINDTGSAFTIGAYADSLGSYKFRGVISNVRVVIGTALYTADFTPPTEELTIVDGTAILCCQDSNDPTQEATGKTITGFGNLATAGFLETQPKVIPPYGVDAGNTFGGPIQQSSQGYMYFPTGRTEERGRGRGIIVGGYNGPSSFGISGVLSAVEIASDGVASKFGDLSETRYTVATVGSSTRSVFIGGAMPVSPSPFFSVNIIDFVTIATKGNAQDFGDSDEVGYFKTGVSSSTRGVYTRGRIYNPSGGTGSNALEFITIATTGNGQDFGDLVGGGRVTLTNSAMSPTRGILAGGVASPVGDPTTFVNTIEFVTMASLGNSVNFGDLQKSGGRSNGNCSSSTRGVFNIGTQSPADGNTLEFVTIATTGDAIDFGDLSGSQQMRGACSNKTRGLFAGGFVAPGSSNYVNTCERITIATTGSAADWGDPFETATGRAYNSGISDSHGGLS